MEEYYNGKKDKKRSFGKNKKREKHTLNSITNLGMVL